MHSWMQQLWWYVSYKEFFSSYEDSFCLKKRYDRNETNLHNIFLRQASNNHDRSTATKYYLHKRSNNERYNKYWKAMNYTEKSIKSSYSYELYIYSSYQIKRLRPQPKLSLKILFQPLKYLMQVSLKGYVHNI